MTPAALAWFRRDLRLGDNPALLAALDAGRVLPVFVLDPHLVRPAGRPRLTMLHRTLRALDADLRERGAALTIVSGDPVDAIPALAAEVGARSVHIAADFGPYGASRDRRVEEALGRESIALVRTGSPYAVAPGRVVNQQGDPYRVFTPFYRAWRRHGWRAPAPFPPDDARWLNHPVDALPPDPVGTGANTHGGDSEPDLPDAGEAAARHVWDEFRRGIGDYGTDRNRPDLDSTSHLSPHLKFGTIHPRTVLAGIASSDDSFARQLAWREFYAAVLHFWPDSARNYFQPRFPRLRYATGAEADRLFEAWRRGRTGYPLVDAGMRQLARTGWMHNRVRMVAASFLVKDLHLEWTRGARLFMRSLVDGDLANNQHGWQWVAGCGTDAAPYYRILNPVTQSHRFDPEGRYIRRWVPELREVDAPGVHEPWTLRGGPPYGYPPPLVDHAEERERALVDYHRGARPEKMMPM